MKKACKDDLDVSFNKASDTHCPPSVPISLKAGEPIAYVVVVAWARKSRGEPLKWRLRVVDATVIRTTLLARGRVGGFYDEPHQVFGTMDWTAATSVTGHRNVRHAHHRPRDEGQGRACAA